MLDNYSRHRIMQQPSRRKGEPHVLCTIRFCFGNARVLVHSLWYADKLNSMAVRAPRRRPTHLCTDDELTSVSCRVRKKMCTLLGGPCHSGAPRLCLPCLPCRDATEYAANVGEARAYGIFNVSLSARPLFFVEEETISVSRSHTASSKFVWY